MIYLALLRGINVGGNNKIEMSGLKAMFESLGFEKVITYINTGNIIFSFKDTPKLELESKLAAAIQLEFNLNIKVLILDLVQIKAMCEIIPKEWRNDSEQKTDVMFLWPETDKPDILNQILSNPDVDKLIYTSGAVIWHIDRSESPQSKMPKIIGTEFYRKMTARNVNTVRKLLELMLK